MTPTSSIIGTIRRHHSTWRPGIETYRIYGIDLAIDGDFGLPLPRSAGPARVRFEEVSDPPVDVEAAIGAAAATSSSAVGGRVAFRFAATGAWDIIRVTDAADYFLSDDLIACRMTNPRHRGLVPVHLFGMVLSLWLERRGVLTLHGSAVTVGGGAVAMLASKGGGKTTMSAALVRGGGGLLTDDLLALTETRAGLLAQPAYPQMRMTREQAEGLTGDAADLEIVNPTTSKLGVPVDRFGTFSTRPAPLRAVYLPARQPPGTDIAIHPLSQRAAFLEVVRHTFLPREVADLGLQRERFHRLTQLASDVPFLRVAVPSGHDRLPEVVDRILADAAAR